MRLYGNAPIMGFGIANYTKPAQLTGGKVGLNVIKNCSDAFTAKITKDRPKISFVTSGAEWDLQQRAQELEKFVDGQFYELGFYDLYPQVVLDQCIFGTGILHPYRKGEGKKERLGLERVPTYSLEVDEQEALYGKPRSFYRKLWVDRQVLLGAHDWSEEARKRILSAKTEHEDIDAVGYSSTADQVLIRHCHHLPSKPDMGDEDTDGRYAITLRNGLLWRESYAYDEPPYVFFRRQMPPLGFFGIGLAEELQGLQIELNVLMQKIQRSFHLLGAGHWLIEKNSRTNKHKLDNDIGSIIEYIGTRPELVAGNPLSPQVFEHIDRIYQRCYEITGISQLEAQSQKPKGLNSGVAIDSYLDITTERFGVAVRLNHSSVVNLAKWVIRLSREVTADNPDFDVMSPQKSEAHHVQFKKNELQDDEYVLKLYPTNALSDDPAEKMSQVESMANSGWIDPTTARRLLDFPDLEAAGTLEDASFNATEMCISAMLKEDKYMGPQQFMDLGTTVQGQIVPGSAMKQVQLAWAKAWAKKVPEAKLTLFKNWLTDAMEMVKRGETGTPPVIPPPPPPGAAPPAAPPPAMPPPPPPAIPQAA